MSHLIEDQDATRSTSNGINASTYAPSQYRNMSGLFGAGQASSAASATQGDISKDVQMQNPPDDSISDISFSPVSNHLAVASWDKKVRIYEIDAQGNSQGKALFDHEGPVMSCAWSQVGRELLLRSLPASPR